MPGIIIPGKTIQYRCGCGVPFFDRKQGIRHAVRCADQNQDEIEAEAARREPMRTQLDPEAWAWGRKREAEGKKGFDRGGPA